MISCWKDDPNSKIRGALKGGDPTVKEFRLKIHLGHNKWFKNSFPTLLVIFVLYWFFFLGQYLTKLTIVDRKLQTWVCLICVEKAGKLSFWRLDLFRNQFLSTKSDHTMEFNHLWWIIDSFFQIFFKARKLPFWKICTGINRF